MVVVRRLPWKRLARDLRVPVVLTVLYIAALAVADRFHSVDGLAAPSLLLTVPGTVIGLLLAFRTDSAYGRWWEARTLWGAIVNDSRTWARQVTTYLGDGGSDNGGLAQRLAYRQIAWCYALAATLRDLDPLESVRELLSGAEIEALRREKNAPNALLQMQARDLEAAFREGRIDSYRFVDLQRTLGALTDSMGGCERIRRTVFPVSYSVLVDTLIYLFIVLFPFTLLGLTWPILVVASLTMALAFLVIDRVAMYLQDPFQNQAGDTPMRALSRTIEINIRQQLGETDLPPVPAPVDGVLM
ncbi:MAG: bestrophin family ion channel [Acidobacteriota bacterium]|jgi:putative membrane protein